MFAPRCNFSTAGPLTPAGATNSESGVTSSSAPRWTGARPSQCTRSLAPKRRELPSFCEGPAKFAPRTNCSADGPLPPAGATNFVSCAPGPRPLGPACLRPQSENHALCGCCRLRARGRSPLRLPRTPPPSLRPVPAAVVVRRFAYPKRHRDRTWAQRLTKPRYRVQRSFALPQTMSKPEPKQGRHRCPPGDHLQPTMGRPSQCWQRLAPERQWPWRPIDACGNGCLELASEERPVTECKERVLGAKLPQGPGLLVDDWQVTVLGLHLSRHRRH